jgi:signal transduction histidine kinase
MRHGIRVSLLQEGMDERLPSEIEVAAYRIVQEALNNVAKHAHASTCRVSLRHAAETMLVTVEDSGEGFDPRRPREGRTSHGLGLIGIRERVTHLGGSLSLESAPGKGTRLTVALPARGPQPAAVDETGVRDPLGPASAPEVSLG